MFRRYKILNNNNEEWIKNWIKDHEISNELFNKIIKKLLITFEDIISKSLKS